MVMRSPQTVQCAPSVIKYHYLPRLNIIQKVADCAFDGSTGNVVHGKGRTTELRFCNHRADAVQPADYTEPIQRIRHAGRIEALETINNRLIQLVHYSPPSGAYLSIFS